MPRFSDLNKLKHVKSHPMFRDRSAHLSRMRKAMQHKKSYGVDLSDVLSQGSAVGRGTHARTLNAYIQEALECARTALDSFDFPIRPDLGYNNAKHVKYAHHDDGQLVDAEILFNLKFKTISGSVQHAVLPVHVSAGSVLPPSVVLHQDRTKVLGQATIDAMVQRATSYELQPLRTQFQPPLQGEGIDMAVEERNTRGYTPRAVYDQQRSVRNIAKKGESAMQRKLRRRMAGPNDATVPGGVAPTSFENADTVAPFENVEPGSEGPNQYTYDRSTTSELYRQILEQPTIMEMASEFMEQPYFDDQVTTVRDAVRPLLYSMSPPVSEDAIDWEDLTRDLTNYIGYDVQSVEGKRKARRVAAFLIGQHLSGQRKFGKRVGATGDPIADMGQTLTDFNNYFLEAADLFSEEEASFYQSLLGQADQAYQDGSYEEVQMMLDTLNQAYEGGDGLGGTVPAPVDPAMVGEGQDWAEDYDQLRMTGSREAAKYWASLKVAKADDIELTKFMPPGYDLVLGDMVKAEEKGFDSFPRQYAHIEKNYILRRMATVSMNLWYPHLVNDGFAINHLGDNRGRNPNAK